MVVPVRSPLFLVVLCACCPCLHKQLFLWFHDLRRATHALMWSLLIKFILLIYWPFWCLLMCSPVESTIVLKIVTVINLTLHQVGQSIDISYVPLWFFYHFHLKNWVLLRWGLNNAHIFYCLLHCIWNEWFVLYCLFKLVFELENTGLILG